MIRRELILLMVASSTGAFAAGCGSSSSSSTSSSAPASSTSSAAASTGSSSSSNRYGGSAASNPAVIQGVAACKASINAQPTLSASLKSQLTGACDKAANGDLAGVRKITAQVCQEVIKASVPASAQTQALAACPKG